MSQVPPNDALCEQLVLGSLINFPERLDTLRPRIHQGLFFSGKHQVLCDCILAAYDTERRFDVPQLVEHVKRHKHVKLLHPADVHEAINSTAVWDLQHTERSVSALEDYQARRVAIDASRLAMAKLYEMSEPFKDTICELDGALVAAANPLASVKQTTMRDAVIAALTLAASGVMSPAIPMQWPALHRDFPGLRNGGLTVLAARPGTGKSALAVQLAVATATAGKGVLFCSLEMPADEITLRMVAHVSGVPLGAIDGSLPVQEVRRLQSLEIQIDDRAGVTIADVRSAALKFKADLEGRALELGLVVIDHMHIMRHGPGRNPVSEINETTMGMKALAKELALPVLALAQLNRNSESRPNECPQLSDLRASGGIEQDADVVMFLHKPSPDQEPRTVQLTVAKNRQGKAPAQVFLDFFGATSRFVEHGDQAPRDAKAADRKDRNGMRAIGGGRHEY